MLSFSFPFKGLFLQASLCLSLTLLLSFLKLHIRFLQGLFTYIHPDNVAQNSANNGVRAAIRRPQASNPSPSLDGYQNLSKRGALEPKTRPRSKQKPEFDESNAQIFRLRLDEGHLETRLYFYDYRFAFTYTILGFSCLSLQQFLDPSHDSGILANGALVPILLGFFGLFRVLVSLGKVSFERSASRRSEKQVSVIVGLLGFLFGLMVLLGPSASVFDFRIDSVDGVGKFLVSVTMGCLAALFYMPALKCTRAFWIGTDQLHWNLSIISCGWTGRLVLYANYLLTTFTSLLWIRPLAEILNHKNISGSNRYGSSIRIGEPEKLAGNMFQSDFTKFRLFCLLASGLLQTLAIRPNLQMYLNEALLSWYQRLHASKVPELDYSRAKVFLHNHYLCLAVLQFFAPSAYILLLLALSQLEGNFAGKSNSMCSLFPRSAILKEVALLLAWWVAFVWAVFTSVTLVLYRRGIWYIS